MLQKKIIESKRKMLPNCTASKAQEQSWKPRTWVNDNDNTWRNRSSKVNESSKVMRHKSPVLCFQEEKLTEAAEWGAKRTKRPPKNLKKKNNAVRRCVETRPMCRTNGRGPPPPADAAASGVDRHHVMLERWHRAKFKTSVKEKTGQPTRRWTRRCVSSISDQQHREEASDVWPPCAKSNSRWGPVKTWVKPWRKVSLSRLKSHLIKARWNVHLEIIQGKLDWKSKFVVRVSRNTWKELFCNRFDNERLPFFKQDFRTTSGRSLNSANTYLKSASTVYRSIQECNEAIKIRKKKGGTGIRRRSVWWPRGPASGDRFVRDSS